MSITVGLIYVGPSTQDPIGQPGFNGAGNIWAQNDTGNWYIRNSSSTGWTILGSGDQPSLGMYPLSGGAGYGTITGNSGLITSDGATPFAIPPTVTNRSSPLASMQDISNLQTNLVSLISDIVTQSVGNVTTTTLGANIAMKVGTMGPASPYMATMQLPYSGMTYLDGTAVKASDCHGFASINSWVRSAGPGASLIAQDPQGMSWKAYDTSGATGLVINFRIIAIRQTS